MKWFGCLILLLTTGFWLSVSAALAGEPQQEFAVWLEALRVEARAAGISQKTLDAALAEVTAPLPRVIESDRNQPEQKETLADYVTARVSRSRIDLGRRMLRRYPTWLGRVERRYRVQRRYIVALWGIETRYGEHTGELPVIPSLVTLAYDQRRGTYFRKELLEALRIVDAGHIPLQQMRGSWAGAMGQCQFMPSSFRRFAVDAAGDGRIDIWNSVPDVLASIANYLAQTGWQDDQIWGRPVRLPKRFDSSRAGLDNRLPLSRWQALGVRRHDGRSLPGRHLEASLLVAEDPGGPAYLVYDNFRSLLAWNRAKAFAVAVGTLAERIGAPR